MAKTKKKAPRRSARSATRSGAAKSRKTGARAKKRATGRKAGQGRAAKRSGANPKARQPMVPKSAKGAAKRSAAKASPRKASAKRVKKAPKSPAATAARKLAAARTAAAKETVSRRPNLDRERRTVREEDMVPSPPSSLNMDRSPSAARSGRKELAQKLREHTSTGPAMTGGDVDADWEDAEAVGDEAPGGDNPTPDQDVVDEIGKALGVEYDDDEELQGGDEIVARDRNRWELDPASKDDFDEEE
jgi:hypothetical protein